MHEVIGRPHKILNKDNSTPMSMLSVILFWLSVRHNKQASNVSSHCRKALSQAVVQKYVLVYVMPNWAILSLLAISTLPTSLGAFHADR